jgi:hypothetical protein
VPPTSPKTGRKANNGPFFSALICERVLTESDGSISAVRIIDQVTIQTPTLVGPGTVVVTAPITLYLLAIVKAYPTESSHELRVDVRSPDKTITTLGKQAAVFSSGASAGGLPGANLIARLQFQTNKAGIYWFDVYLDGGFKTSAPLRVVFE